jgi:hypothetical protein
MVKSVNHSWGISPKFRQKYGETWADIDFYFADKISEDRFKSDPMNCDVGTLHVARQDFKFTYKDLLGYTSAVATALKKSYMTKSTEALPVDIKGRIILLNKTELNRLRETLNDAVTSVQRAYELGLYL